jgi:hypothetical protein
VEGDGVTDPDFLDDPANIIPGAPGALRLDDTEELVREDLRLLTGAWRRCSNGNSFVRTISRGLAEDSLEPISFDPYRARPLPGQNAARVISDLAKHRWYWALLSPEQEIDAVSRIQSADICGPLRSSFRGFDEFAKLLAGFHGKVLQVANGHMPKRWRQRLALREKYTNNLLFEDFVAAGVAAMWKAALKFDLGAGYRFWTGVRAPVLGAISDEARIWRRHGSGEGRLDRWLYTHPSASPEQVLRAQARRVKRPVFHSLQEAAEGIKLFWAWSSEFDYSTEADEKFAAGDISYFAGMYSCFNRFTLSAQLRIRERFSDLVDRFTGGLDFGPGVGNATHEEEPKDLLDYTETAVIQFKNGKRQVTRQKRASPVYRIPVTWALQARAKRDLEFAKRRWERRTKFGLLPAQTYPRWSTKFGVGLPEHENKQIVPARVPAENKFRWVIEYRSAEGDLLSVLECPSRHCFREECVGGQIKLCPHQDNRTSALRSRRHNVPSQSISLSAA